MYEEINRTNLGRLQVDCTPDGILIWIQIALRKTAHCKNEHYLLVKEAVTLLELDLWKANLDGSEDDMPGREGVRTTRRQKKRARQEARLQKQVTSGASIIIRNVLPFLLLPEN